MKKGYYYEVMVGANAPLVYTQNQFGFSLDVLAGSDITVKLYRTAFGNDVLVNTWNHSFTEAEDCPVPPEVIVKQATCDAPASITVTYDEEYYYYTIQFENGQEMPLASGTTTFQKFTALGEFGDYTVRGYKYDYQNEREIQVYEKSFTLTVPSCEPGKGSVDPGEPAPELPHTGPSYAGVLVAILGAALTYGALYFAQPRRWYEN